jgi:Lrp/AsnC family transcriptional regulator, regulator for asnA, asnC and gidA
MIPNRGRGGVNSLDELDCRIVQLLQQDARMSSGDMTRRLGDVSDRVVRYRVNRLLDRKVVLLQAMVNPRRVGFPVVADILIEVAPWKLAETCARLLEMKLVASASASHAGRQLSIQVNARDEGQLASFVNQTLPQIDGFVSARAAVVPQLVKDLAYWSPADVAAPERGPVRGVWHEEAEDPRARFYPDDLDRRIISLSQEDPRMSSRDMARRLGDISDRVVRYRLKRLLDSHVLIVQARINPHEVGYPVVADSLIEVLPWRFADVCAALVAIERVCYISAAPLQSGGRQLSIETNCRNENELTDFVQTRLPRIDGIVGAQTMVVPRLVKDVAAWEIPGSP